MFGDFENIQPTFELKPKIALCFLYSVRQRISFSTHNNFLILELI
jgi:hypothetical protein